MVRRLMLATAILALAHPASSQVRCSKPYAPVISPSAKATMQDMVNMRGDVTAFIAATDLYQACLSRLPPSQQNDNLARASQNEKVRIGKTFNEYVRAFKASNPS